MEPILFPDVEAALVEWLEDVLADHGITTTAHTIVPNPRPDEFVRAQRTGGPALNLVTDGAQVTFECWALTTPRACEMVQTLRAVVLAARNVTLPTGDLLYRVQEFAGPALLPDISGHPRYSWTAQVQMRGNPL